MEFYFKKATLITTADIEPIDFFNKEQKKSAIIAIKELVKNGDVCVKVKGRLAFIGGTNYSAVVNRLGYSIVLSDDDIEELLHTSLSQNFKGKIS